MDTVSLQGRGPFPVQRVVSSVHRSRRATGIQGLVSAAGPGPVGGVTPAEGWASVENQDDMADLALVRAPPTD